MIIITESNYLENYPLIDFSKLTTQERYDCTNLNGFLLTNIDYQNISKRKEGVLKLVNDKKLILTEEYVRLDMDINNPKTLTLRTCLGRDLRIGDILPSGRTCKTGLPVYFTFDRVEEVSNGDFFIFGKENGMVLYQPTKWYCVGTIK